MLKPISTRTQDIEYWRGSSGSLKETVHQVSGLDTGLGYQYRVALGISNTGVWTYGNLIAAPQTSVSAYKSALAWSTDFDGSGDAGAISNTVNNVQGAYLGATLITDNDMLDAAKAADDTAPCALTSLVNSIPNLGTVYTNSTLYAELQRLYPGMGIFYAGSQAGNVITVAVPYANAAGMDSRYGYHSGDIDDDYIENAPGVSYFAPSWMAGTHFTGESIDGNPDLLEGNNWPSAAVLMAWLLLVPNPPKYKCVVDMYFNGSKEPNISMQWKGYDDDQESMNEVLTASNLHVVNYAPADIQTTYEAYYTYIDSETGIRRMNDLVFNAVNKLRYIKPVAPGDKINTSYLSQVDGIIGTMNQAQRILEYGINGLPEHLVWYLQVEDPEHNLSSLWQLAEPRESETGLVGYVLTEFSDAKDPGSIVALEVVLHEGPNPDDITDDDTTPPPPPPKPTPTDWDGDEGHGFPGDAVLTKTYSMTAAVLQNIGQKLWTQSYFDVLKIQNNPIQNVVSVKWFPFNLSDGTTESVKVGNVDFGINATRINTVKRITIGSVTYTGVYGNFLDGSPYTTLKLNLPYVGQIQLDASEFLGCSIGVEYIIDLITGECVARVKRDGVPLYDYPGHMGVDIVLTSSDRVQADMKAVSSGIHTAANTAGELIQGDVIGAVAGAATGALSVAGMDYNSQRVGSPSGVCGSFQNHKVWLTVSYPKYYQSEGFTHVFGRPVNKYLTLDKFSNGDYVQVDRRTDLKIAMTSDENAELEKLLVGGVYI